MTRNTSNPLDGLSQAQIDIVMAKTCKDRNPEETRVYKKVKMDEWLIRKGKAPAASKTVSRSLPPKPSSSFVQPTSEKSEEIPSEKSEEIPSEKVSTSRRRITSSNGKIPYWITIPALNDEWKEWANERKILVSADGKIHISHLSWIGEDELPTIRISGKADIFFLWETAYVAIKHGFIREYNRDGIKKESDNDIFHAREVA